MFNRLKVDQSGQSQTEYAMALVLVAIVAIGALALVGTAASGVFGRTVDFLSGAEENANHIVVTAVDAEGRGIQNIRIYAFHENGRYTRRYGNTNAEGELVFDDLDEGNYLFRAHYQRKTFWSDTLSWPESWQTTIETGRRPVTVSVVDAAGEGIGGVRVYAFTPAGRYAGAYGISESDGTVGLHLSDGDYRFRVNYRRNRYWSDDITTPAALSASVDTGQRPFDVTVTNRTGIGLSNIRVYAFNTSGRYIGVYGNTDTDGIARLAIPDGDYRFRVDYRRNKYWSDDVTSPASTSISVQTDEAPVTVSLQNRNGTGLNNVRVYAFDAAGHYVGVHGNTDRDGKVVLNLPAGEFKFQADYRSNRYWSETITTPATATATIETGEQRISVTVLDQAGSGIRNVRVYAFSARGRYVGVFGNTNAHGETTIRLPNGDYQFQADYRGHQFWSTTINVPATMTATVQTGESNSQVTVSAANGEPLHNARVYAYTATGLYVGVFGNTDRNGELILPLPVGQFQYRVDYRGDRTWSGTFNAPGNVSVTFPDE